MGSAPVDCNFIWSNNPNTLNTYEHDVIESVSFLYFLKESGSVSRRPLPMARLAETPNGLSLIATDDIKAGYVVLELNGHVSSQKQFRRTSERGVTYYSRLHDVEDKYLPVLCIDHRGKYTSYIGKSCAPNCTVKECHKRFLEPIIFCVVAQKDIKKGDEITIAFEPNEASNTPYLCSKHQQHPIRCEYLNKLEAIGQPAVAVPKVANNQPKEFHNINIFSDLAWKRFQLKGLKGSEDDNQEFQTFDNRRSILKSVFRVTKSRTTFTPCIETGQDYQSNEIVLELNGLLKMASEIQWDVVDHNEIFVIDNCYDTNDGGKVCLMPSKFVGKTPLIKHSCHPTCHITSFVGKRLMLFLSTNMPLNEGAELTVPFSSYSRLSSQPLECALHWNHPEQCPREKQRVMGRTGWDAGELWINFLRRSREQPSTSANYYGVGFSSAPHNRNRNPPSSGIGSLIPFALQSGRRRPGSRRRHGRHRHRRSSNRDRSNYRRNGRRN